MTSVLDGVVVDNAGLGVLSRQMLVAAGASEDAAALVTEHLQAADAMGVHSHGIIRLPQYLEEIAAGDIDPSAAPTVHAPHATHLAFDGGRGFGQVVGERMAKECIAVAQTTGTAFATGRNMGHTGRIGAYAETLAAAGCVGIVTCSGPASGHWVAPFGGRAGRLATNPIAYAYPTEAETPFASDFSTSVLPEGAVRRLHNYRRQAPEGVLRDAAGAPTRDPAQLYASPPGALQPMGGPVGYRGTALAILVEVLAGLLAGDETADESRVGSNLAMLAIVADKSFAGRAERMRDYIASSPPIRPDQQVLLPGQREEASRAAQATTTLIDSTSWDRIVALADGRFDLPISQPG